MALIISTNLAALRTTNVINQTNNASIKSLERLSSGFRINRAADDAAGMSISVGLHTQARGMQVAVRNTQDGISVIQTADGALDGTSALLHRMRDLSVQAASDGSLDATAKGAIQSEMVQLTAQLTRIARGTTFNNVPLLDGTYDKLLQVGPNMGETVPVTISLAGKGADAIGLGLVGIDVSKPSASMTTTATAAISDDSGVPTPGQVSMAGDFVNSPAYIASFQNLAGTITYNGRSFDLGSVDYTGAVTATDYLTKLVNAAMPVFGTSTTPFTGSAASLVMTGDNPGVGSSDALAARLSPAYSPRMGADAAMTAIDTALTKVSNLRAYLGATQNRLEHVVNGLGVMIENTTASKARITDTDMAAEMSAFSGHQVRNQAGIAMLAQANQVPNGILKLLG